MKNILTLALVSCSLFLYPQITNASSIGGVGSGVVKQGRLGAELRQGVTADYDDRSQHKNFQTRAHIDYGFTDWFALRGIIVGGKEIDKSFQYRAAEIEAHFQFFEQNVHGFNAGMRLEYSHRNGNSKPDIADVRFIFSTQQDNWNFRFNQFFSHEVGKESVSGINLETRLRLGYDVTEATNIGAEYFADFGNVREFSGFQRQRHTAGPSLRVALTEDYYFDAAYRYRLSDAAPKSTVRLGIGVSF